MIYPHPHQGHQPLLLEEGYDADIVALDANPLDDISLWGDPNRVTHVWKDGNRVKGEYGSQNKRP